MLCPHEQAPSSPPLFFRGKSQITCLYAAELHHQCPSADPMDKTYLVASCDLLLSCLGS